MTNESGRIIWNRYFKILEDYINSSEEAKKYFEQTGSVNSRKVLKIKGKKVYIGRWLSVQKQKLMKKYEAMNIEQIENNSEIPQEDKYRMKKLLNLGVSFSVDKIQIEKYLWDEKFGLLRDYINSSEKVNEYFKQNGDIPEGSEVEKNDMTINLTNWVITQKYDLMKKYKGMSIEQIKEETTIPKKDKYKMIKLLELGVSYPNIEERTSEEIWNEKYEVLVKYINSSEKIKEHFNQTGSIDQKAIFNINGKSFCIGNWLLTQKQIIMKKYQDMSIAQIKKSKKIPETDKDQMLKLLKLGVSYSKLQEKPYKEQWEDNFEALVEYINSSEEVRTKFENTGKISFTASIEKNGKIINVGKWFRNQKEYISRRNPELNLDDLEEVENSKTISESDKYKIKKLQEIGILVGKKSNDEIWDENFNLLKQYIDSLSEEAKRRFEEFAFLPKKAVVQKGKKVLNVETWVASQRQNLLKKYEGMTIEEIEKSELIPDRDKYRVKKLVELGIVYPKKEKVIEKTSKRENNWNRNFELLKKYINSSEEIKEKFEKKGSINERIVIEDNGEIVNIGTWVNSQRQKLMKKYQGMNIKEIKSDKEISEIDKYKLLKLLELGIKYPKITGQELGKASFDVSVKDSDEANNIVKQLVNSKRKGEIVING